MALKIYRLSMLFQPSDEIPGSWAAHVLDFGLVTQGESLDHAVAMALEAITMVVQDDFEHGFDSFDRKRSPAEFWREHERLMKHGKGASSASGSQRVPVAMLVDCRIPVSHRPKSTPGKATMGKPIVWQHAA